MIKLAIFASGSGSNARKIVEYFSDNELIAAGLIVTNKEKAGVLQHAEATNVPSLVVSRDSFSTSKDLLTQLSNHEIDYIILAGFLWKIPDYLLQQYPNKILNIHPSLLPKYGGKGMYGMRVHEAVKQAREEESGMTIHQVNEQYDEGKIVFQDSCSIASQDTTEEIAAKVLALEHQHYAPIIEAYILDRLTS